MGDKQSGFAVIYVLIVAAFVVSVALGTFGSISNLNSLSAREKIRSQSQSVFYSFRMLFKEQASCTSGLLRDPFLTELKKKIENASYTTDPQLKIDYPVAAGNPSMVFVGTGTTFDQLTVKSVSVDRWTRPNPTAAGYLAVVKIEFEKVDGYRPKPLELPVYTTLDGSNTPKDCFTSSFASDDVTVEDFLCTTLKGAGYKYDPVNKSCFI